MMAEDPDEIDRLLAENARLIALLESHGHATKTDVRVIDFVDTGHTALLRMWEKRRRGYLAMGYQVAEPRE